MTESTEAIFQIQWQTVEQLKAFIESMKAEKQSEYIRKIRELEEELNHLKTSKKYGIVFEEKREDFEERSRNALPVLQEVTSMRIDDTGESPTNIVIEGDNYHALSCLRYTHKGKVDVIYIDPPYNTGNKDFIYNDRFVDKEDTYRHSKWLSFMKKRLVLAQELLSESGVIFISIDDNEQAQLKMLCDEVFGEKNFIANVIWSAGRKNDSKYVSISHEYIIAYFKNIDYIKSNNVIWREKKDGLKDIYGAYDKLKKKFGNDYVTIETELKNWYKGLSDANWAKKHKHYSSVDERGIYFRADISWPGGWGPKYDVIHPVTWMPVTVPSRGWIYSSPSRMQEMIDWGFVQFGEDEKAVPTLKSYLKNREYQVPYSVIYQDGRSSTKRLRELMGWDVFENPKDESILKKIISFSSLNPNAIILDFFAGSGTTGHAVLELNREDGGNRQFILCSNREATTELPDKNICRDITYERVKRVATGYTNSKGEPVAGLGGKIRYYQTDFIGIEKSRENLKQKFMLRCNDLIMLKENTFDEVTLQNPIPWLFLYRNGEWYTAVAYDYLYLDQVRDFLRSLNRRTSLYIFSISSGFIEEFEDMKDMIDVKSIPEEILEVYLRIFNL